MLKRLLFRVFLLVPYPVGSKLLYCFAGMRLVQWLFFRRTVQLFSDISAELGWQKNSAELTRGQIASSMVDPWRVVKLARMSESEFERWVTIENLDLLLGKMSTGNGVLIANSHTSMSRSLPLLLARKGIRITTLEGDSYFKKLNVPYAKDLDSIEMRSSDGFYLKILSKAKNVLTSGNVLLMAPDGLQGMGTGDDFPFLGKQRPFFVSFASLALKAGSTVLFCDIRPDQDGHIWLRFIESQDDQMLNMEERIAHVATNYVRHLEGLWQRDVSLVHGKHLAYFCSL